LKQLLPPSHIVTLVSPEETFTFIPGLIQVALNLKPLHHIQIELAELSQRHRFRWLPGQVTALDPYRQQLTVNGETLLDYDFVLIATGASLAFDQVPGLGPDGGYTHSVCTAEHALGARQAWLQFLDHPGSLVVGAAPGTGCFGPAYEFVLMAERELRRRRVRDQVPITYVTPEPYLGHLGVSGVKNAEKLTAELMHRRGIEVITNTAITAATASGISLADGRHLPAHYAMILPAFRGAAFLRAVPGLTDDKGLVPILPTQQHPRFPTIYAAGVSVQLRQPDITDVPIGLPKSGQMTEAMATAAAHNIAVAVGALNQPMQSPTLDALCFAEFGETGIAYIAAPVIPDPELGKRRSSYAARGSWVVWVKAAFEEYFMLKMRWGIGMPWYEKLGLRALFNLRLFQPVGPREASGDF